MVGEVVIELTLVDGREEPDKREGLEKYEGLHLLGKDAIDLPNERERAFNGLRFARE